MKYSWLPAAAVIIAGASSASAATLPGAPEANGLAPQTATLYINGTNNINNFNTESIGVAIASTGNVLVGWEDDNDNEDYSFPQYKLDLQGTWTMFDSVGNPLTLPTKIYSEYFSYSMPDPTWTNTYLGLFRTNGTLFFGTNIPLALAPGDGWGPKIHANPFGTGIGFGLTALFALTYEDERFGDYFGYGDFPAVQLLDGAGAPQTMLPGVTGAFMQIHGGGEIRIGDWEYLANGNIVIIGESRRTNDLAALYGYTGPITSDVQGRHAIFRVVTQAGANVRSDSHCGCASAIVEGEALVSSTNSPNEIWHGAAAAKDGFAVRFSDRTLGTCVRMFDNNGNPTTANLVLTTFTGYPQSGGGGRGGGAGFHGNGKDAYIHAANYSVGGTNGFWATVLNTNGTVRWSRDVSDDLTLVSAGDGDAAITESGEVVVVFNAVPASGLNSVVLARRFDAAGNPVGGTFYVSEKEVPNLVTPPPAAVSPRVACRNDKVAIVWESKSYPYLPAINVIAQRYFLLPPSLSVSLSGTSVMVSWSPSVTGYTLESSSSLATGSWTPVSGVINNSLTTNSPAGARFYRLKK